MNAKTNLPTNLYTLALHLFNVYPTFDEFEIKDTIEELINQRVKDEDFQKIKAIDVRVSIQKGDFEQ